MQSIKINLILIEATVIIVNVVLNVLAVVVNGVVVAVLIVSYPIMISFVKEMFI